MLRPPRGFRKTHNEVADPPYFLAIMSTTLIRGSYLMHHIKFNVVENNAERSAQCLCGI